MNKMGKTKKENVENVIQRSSKVAIGISGGVDSAVSAFLLKEQGYDVIGLFMKNWDEDDDTEYCTAEQDYKDAKKVCKHLNIPLYFANFAAEYWSEVFEKVLEFLDKGWTPNPDIWCNQYIKFHSFYQHAKSLGAQYIATGHYAKHDILDEEHLFLSKDANKDQTYFLYSIQKEVLAKSIFPLGDYLKSEVRAIAKKISLPNADRKDSTGICFIGKRSFRDFISKYYRHKKGNIVSLEGEKLGEHWGVHLHTMGQRSGLHIGGQKGHNIHQPWYVVNKNISTNELVVAQGKDNPNLYSSAIECFNLKAINLSFMKQGQNILVRFRHRGSLSEGVIEKSEESTVTVRFKKPQKAIALGQSAVFYVDNECIGGGIICEKYNDNK